MNKKIFILIILVSSILTHFVFFGHPQETVFDEVHFGKFISGYYTHEYFFDIHPPLGKLLISGMGAIGGFQPGFSFAEIGQGFPDNAYLWLRLLPTIAGMLLPFIIFLIALRFGLSPLGSFAAGMFAVLENSLLVQSRFILLDAFLLVFGFSALLSYLIFWQAGLAGRQEKKFKFLVLSGVLAALAVSVKWTGATFLAVILAAELVRLIKIARSHGPKQAMRPALRSFWFALALPAAVYFSVFAIHLQLLGKSGPGDAFMTPEFRKTLAGNADSANPDIKPLNIFQKFTELNKVMYTANATLTAGHPYSSQWYSWPFLIRPIYYWYKAGSPVDSEASRIYLLGNPAIWWPATAAMLYISTSLIFDKNSRKKKKLWLIIGIFALNLLPFIGIKRAMFLYHYTTALIVAIIGLAYLVDQSPKRKTVFPVILATAAILFIFFSPLTYGLPLTDSAYNARVWLNSWR